MMTPECHAELSKEMDFLIYEERPRITEIVSWAAGNGDRSENGDYIYNKKKLREIDRRLRYLNKVLDDVKIVDPKDQQGIEQVFFGATVTYAKENDTEVTVKLVSVDEANFTAGKINWLSPVGRALMKAHVGDEVKVVTDAGEEYLEVLKIEYRLEDQG
jgi:transcription elongation factor GreB